MLGAGREEAVQDEFIEETDASEEPQFSIEDELEMALRLSEELVEEKDELQKRISRLNAALDEAHLILDMESIPSQMNDMDLSLVERLGALIQQKNTVSSALDATRGMLIKEYQQAEDHNLRAILAAIVRESNNKATKLYLPGKSDV